MSFEDQQQQVDWEEEFSLDLNDQGIKEIVNFFYNVKILIYFSYKLTQNVEKTVDN